MSVKKNNAYLKDLIWLIVGIGLLYYGLLGSHPLFIPDEGRYSEIAREMVATHDYITPRLNGIVFLDKPILYYWLQASAIHWFGVKEWALRFWPATLGVLGCLVTYGTTRFLFDRRTGLLASIILAANPFYYGAAHYANLDLEVAVFISAALLFSLCGLQSQKTKQRTLFFCFAYVASALAILTKGLIGIAFPILIIGAWALLRRRWSILKEIGLLSGFCIIAILVIPWYYLVQKANPEFLHFFFITQQVSRFLSHDVFNGQKPFLFFIPVLFAGLFPWSLFLIQALIKTTRSCWFYPKEHPKTVFLSLWFWIIFIFFSLPQSKLIGYILPALPAAAILIAHYINAFWNSPEKPHIRHMILYCIIGYLVVAALCFIIPSLRIITDAETPASQIHGLYALGGLFILGSIPLWFSHCCRHIFYGCVAMACITILFLFSSASTINQKTIKPLALQMKPLIKPNDEVVAFYQQRYDLPLYLERRITMVADWHAPDIAEHDNWVRELWYGIPFQKTSDWLINEPTFWKHWHSRKRVWVWVDVGAYHDFKKKAGGQFYLVGQYNETFVITNHRTHASLPKYMPAGASPL